MRKSALLVLVAVVSFGFVGCASAPPPPKSTSDWWTEANKDKTAMISGKEMKMVPMKDHPGMEVPEYRVELIWLDARRWVFPSSWITVGVETYQSVNAQDYVTLQLWYADKEGSHVRVYYFWKHTPSGRQYRVDYEYEDLGPPEPKNQ